jgi:hypothetical protein
MGGTGPATIGQLTHLGAGPCNGAARPSVTTLSDALLAAI